MIPFLVSASLVAGHHPDDSTFFRSGVHAYLLPSDLVPLAVRDDLETRHSAMISYADKVTTAIFINVRT